MTVKGATWSICSLHWPLQWYGLCRSPGIHTFWASRSSAELLSRAGVKEVVKEVSWCLYRTSRPPITVNQSCLCRALRNVTTFGRYRAQLGLCMPPDAPLFPHTLLTESPTTLHIQHQLVLKSWRFILILEEIARYIAKWHSISHTARFWLIFQVI